METAASLRACVPELFKERTREKALARLKAAGERAVPVLLEALDEVRPDDSVLEAILEALDPHLSPAMVPRIAELLESPEVWLRAKAARMLGRIGSDEAAEPISGVLADDHDAVRDAALTGIREGLEEKRQIPAFLARVFDPIASLIGTPDEETFESEPAVCLLGIDREKAVRFLLDETRFCADNPRLFKTLEALNDAEVLIPPEELIPVLDGLRPEWDVYPIDCAYGEGLKALARAKHPDAARRIEEALRAEDEFLAQLAAEALAELDGLPDPFGYATKRLEEAGDELRALPEPLRNYLLVRRFADEVEEGGYAEFFLSPSGDHAAETPAALRAIGAVEAADILEEALALFGRGGPSRDHERRKGQVERIIEADEAAFASFHLGGEPIGVLLDQYARSHKREFGGKGGGAGEAL